MVLFSLAVLTGGFVVVVCFDVAQYLVGNAGGGINIRSLLCLMGFVIEAPVLKGVRGTVLLPLWGIEPSDIRAVFLVCTAQ